MVEWLRGHRVYRNSHIEELLVQFVWGLYLDATAEKIRINAFVLSEWVSRIYHRKREENLFLALAYQVVMEKRPETTHVSCSLLMIKHCSELLIFRVLCIISMLVYLEILHCAFHRTASRFAICTFLYMWYTSDVCLQCRLFWSSVPSWLKCTVLLMVFIDCRAFRQTSRDWGLLLGSLHQHIMVYALCSLVFHSK